MTQIYKFLKQGLVYDLPQEEYHQISGSFSSSQLKDLLDDAEIFHRKYIAKTEEKQSLAAFDIGHYFHTAVLEPEKLKDECIVFKGIRRGNAWDEFKIKHSSKTIITESEFLQAEGLIEAVKKSKLAMSKISQGKPEVSAFLKILVSKGEIFAPDYGYKFSKDPREIGSLCEVMPTDAVEIILKVRADLLAKDFILDLKSTTGNAKSPYLMTKKVSDYHYDLSAALYLDIFSIVSKNTISDFYWTFASKDTFGCKTYLAVKDHITIGRAKWRKTVLTLANNIKNDWKFEDTLGFLMPQNFEYDHLKQTEGDLL
jgi:hypothetical protein